jgi:hypothetical protein
MFAKTFQQSLFRTMFALIFVACLLSIGTSLTAAQSISNEKEVRAALRNARTADDHLRISAYYSKKAEELQNKEQEQQELAEYYRTHIGAPKYPPAYQTHKGLADYYHQAASKALQKAHQHEQYAQYAQSLETSPR